MHQAVFFSLTAWWKGRLILCTRTASINQCHLPFPFLYISFFLKSLWPFLFIFFIPPPCCRPYFFYFVVGMQGTWHVLEMESAEAQLKNRSVPGRKEQVEGTLWRRAAPRPGHGKEPSASHPPPWMAPCRPQRCRGLPTATGSNAAHCRVLLHRWVPRQHLPGSRGRSRDQRCMPAVLREHRLRPGRAAGTADRRTGAVWRRLGRSAVPFLTSKAGCFLAPGRSSLAQPCRPHLPLLHRPSPPAAPALTQRHRAQPARFHPGHGACTAAAAQPRQSPTALGSTRPRQAPGKPPAGGLLCRPGWQIQQPGEKQREKGHNQAEIPSGYAAPVRYGRRFLDEGLRCFQKLGPRLHPGPPMAGRGPSPPPWPTDGARDGSRRGTKRAHKIPGRSPEGFSSWAAFLSWHPTLHSVTVVCLSSRGPLEEEALGNWDFHRGICEAIIFLKRHWELIFHIFFYTLKY